MNTDLPPRTLSIAVIAYRWCFLFALVSPATTSSYGQGSDVILQAFHWNAHPGDLTDPVSGGVWWDSLATLADAFSASGIGTVWVPPPQKSFGGPLDMGYAPYDFYDLGEYDQRGSVRTRFGNRAQLDHMIAALHNASYGSINVMGDLVLNHRGGSDELPGGGYRQEYEKDYRGFVDNDPGFGWKDARWWGYTYFNPLSGRWSADASDFHPNATHDTIQPPPSRESMERYPLFFEDMCFLNHPDTTPPPGGWYNGPHNVSHVADSAIAWARWLLNDVGFDEIRLDAVRHIDPEFVASFLVELSPGPPEGQPYAAGEIFSYDRQDISDYDDRLRGFGTGARLAYLDFPLRGALKAMTLSAGQFDMANLGSSGMNPRGEGDARRHDVVTFVDNHDVRRAGWAPVQATGSPPCGATAYRGRGPAENTCFKRRLTCVSDGDIPFGDTCLRRTVDGNEDPAGRNRFTLSYPFLMASEGRPMLYWDDWIEPDKREGLDWLTTLRSATAAGETSTLSELNPSFSHGWNAADIFAFSRTGSADRSGLVFVVNDRPDSTATGAVWVDSPFRSLWLRDYSDQTLFEATHVFADGRVNLHVSGQNYAWYAPTGLLPSRPRTTEKAFELDAEPGGCPHWVVLQTADSSSFRVGKRAIRAGDQIAVTGADGKVTGLSRVGQTTQWNGIQDMTIEVLGGLPDDGSFSGGRPNGMSGGEALHLIVFDSLTADIVPVDARFANVGSPIVVFPSRPLTRPPTTETVVSASSSYTCLGVSKVTSFQSGR